MEINSKKTGYSWLRQLLISILGTSIGVGLTFGINRYVDYSKQKNAQRETAIMAVCDIDEISRLIKEEIHLEDSLFKVAMYVSTHQELIDKLPMDTIKLAFEYLYEDPMKIKGWTSDTKENAFNSGIDARMNIGNNQFYDNVQLCYYLRRSLIKVMADAPVFRRPLGKEDYEEILQKMNPAAMDFSGVPSLDALRVIIKEFYALGATTLYINRYFSRRDSYLRVAYQLERLNRENKLLMNISDKDIEGYIKINSDNISNQVSEDLIVGMWEMGLNDKMQTYVFKEDKTVEKTFQTDISMQIMLPEEKKEVYVLVPLTIFMEGQWELKGDTLSMDFDASKSDLLSFDLDVSNFPQSSLERLKDSLEIKKEGMKNYLLEGLRQQKVTDVCAVSFDKSGSTMRLTIETISPMGDKQKASIQLYRKFE